MTFKKELHNSDSKEKNMLTLSAGQEWYYRQKKSTHLQF